MERKCLYGVNRAIKMGLGVVVGLLLAFGLANWVFGAVPFEDNFNSYIDGDLAPQGDWQYVSGINWQVQGDNTFEGLKSIRADKSGSSSRNKKFGNEVENGIWEFYILSEDCVRDTYFILHNQDEVIVIQAGVIDTGTECRFYVNNYEVGWQVYDVKTLDFYNSWRKIQIEWETTNDKVRVKLENQDFSDWYNTAPFLAVKGFDLYTYADWDKYVYFDNLKLSEIEFKVWVSTPASGSTITDIDQTFTINWQGWDFEWIYKDFFFYFNERNTGIVSKTIYYEPITESGSVVYYFSDFGLDRNTYYDFSARARSYLIEWTEYRTGNLVDPAFYIITNIEGWETTFAMPDWEIWYTENVDQFATPTAVFSGVVGFLSPLYNTIGEFGNRVSDFLDPDEANELGFNLGKAIPLFRHYVSEIQQFFGGFPVITLFLVILILLLAIFIVRLILKFIPGLG